MYHVPLNVYILLSFKCIHIQLNQNHKFNVCICFEWGRQGSRNKHFCFSHPPSFVFFPSRPFFLFYHPPSFVFSPTRPCQTETWMLLGRDQQLFSPHPVFHHRVYFKKCGACRSKPKKIYICILHVCIGLPACITF